MAFERHAEGTAASAELLLFLRPNAFAHPVTKPVDFDRAIGGALDPHARELLAVATAQRAKLEAVLNDSKAAVDPRNVAAAVEAYLPSVWRLTTSFEASGGVAVKLNTPLEFKWTSPLALQPKEWSFGVLIFEVIFVLSVRAVSHRDAARVVLAGDAKRITEATKELRLGAGIFEFLRKELLPRWHKPPALRPLETLAPVLHCLESFFLADAQRFAVQKAIEAGSQPSVTCKLLLGCADKYDFAARAISSLDNETFKTLGTSMLEEIGAYPAILRAVAANELAQHFKAKDEPARAAGLARDAFHRFFVISMGEALRASPLQMFLEEAQARALVLAKEYESECTNVYFCVPAKDNLGWPEEGSFIVSAAPYEMPTGDIVSFQEVPGGKPSAAGSGKPAPTTDSRGFFEKLWPGSSSAAASGADKGKAQAKGDDDLQPPPGVDAATFAELPEGIRRELAAGKGGVTTVL